MINFLFGLLLMFMGAAMVVWGHKLNNFMPFEFGRSLVGSGSAAYQLLGVVLVLLSFLFIFGVLNIFG
jgi:hypothetical protein